jgi:hypothetical protein
MMCVLIFLKKERKMDKNTSKKIEKVYNYLLEKKEKLTEREFEKAYGEEFEKIEKLYDAISEGKVKGLRFSDDFSQAYSPKVIKLALEMSIKELEKEIKAKPKDKGLRMHNTAYINNWKAILSGELEVNDKTYSLIKGSLKAYTDKKYGKHF